jgi:integrase
MVADEINRVLRPKEADMIYDIIPKDKHKKVFDTALNSGMRYKEIREFAKKPELHRPDRFEIFLPRTITKTQKDRYVHLTKSFNKLLVQYLKTGLEPPHPRTWYDNIQRWSRLAGIKDWHNINIKTTRKTWESWLLKAGYDSTKILLSQGHIESVAIMHYFNMSFTEEEIEEIKIKTMGWTG